MKDATRAILYLIAAEMERQGVKRVEDLKLTETNTDSQKVDLCKLRKMIDREPDKLVVPQSISAPGYESGLAAKQTEQQQNCPYCHEPYKAIGINTIFGLADEIYEDDGEGIFVKDGKIIALSESGITRFEQDANFCPICGRELEA